MRILFLFFIYLFTCSCVTEKPEWEEIHQEPVIEDFVGVWKCTTKEKEIIFLPNQTFRLENGDTQIIDEGTFFFKKEVVNGNF